MLPFRLPRRLAAFTGTHVMPSASVPVAPFSTNTHSVHAATVNQLTALLPAHTVSAPKGMLAHPRGVGTPTGVCLAPVTHPDHTHDDTEPTQPPAESTEEVPRQEAPKTPKLRSTHEDLFVVDNVRLALESLLGSPNKLATAATKQADPAVVSPSSPATRRAGRRPTHTTNKNAAADDDHASEPIDAVAVADLDDAHEHECDHGAEDMTDPLEHTTHTRQEPFTHQTSQVMRASSSSSSSATAADIPRSVCGVPYPQPLASALRVAAVSRGFRSPVWSSRMQFAQIGVTVLAADSEGVAMEMANSTVSFFNLEQSDAKDCGERQLMDACASHGLWTPHVTRTPDRSEPRQARLSREEWLKTVPRDIRGLRFRGSWGIVITTSPRFEAYQRLSPFWITLTQAITIGAEVRAEEMAHAVIMAEETDYVATDHQFPQNDNAAILAAHAAAANASPGATLLYNCSQLTTPDRFAVCALGAMVACVNWKGRRYGPSTCFLLLEYCREHAFTMRDPLQDRVQEGENAAMNTPPGESWAIVFITESTLHRRDGVVQPWPRGAASVNATPPFTMMMHDGSVLVLYNAEQTSLFHELKQECQQNMRERRDLFRAKQ